MDTYDLEHFMKILKNVRRLLDCNLDFDFQMDQMLRMIAESIRCETATIAVRQDESWIVRYTYGFLENIIGKQLTNENETHALLAIQSKEPVVISDTSSDSRINKNHMQELGIKSIIVIPLIIKNDVWGVAFFPYYKETKKFDDNIIEIANIFTDLISNKFETMRLNEMASKAVRANREIENKYKVLFDSIDEGLCIIDVIFDQLGKPIDFIHLEANAAFEKQVNLNNITGLRAKEIDPDSFERCIDIFGKVALTGEAVRFEMHSSFSDSWYSIYSFKINRDRCSTIAILLKNISEQIKTNQELKRSLEAHEEVFANIAHELKTPLNVIYSANQLMEYYFKTDSVAENRLKIVEEIGMVKQNCYRFSKLISNIVDLSTIDTGFCSLQLSNENIVEVVENVVMSVSDYMKESHLNIIFDTDVEEKILACDPEKIERIILNLLTNAIKFSNPNGSINVDITDLGHAVQISVRDDGVGIDKKDINTIFDRFSRLDRTLARNTEGTGIGLSLVKGLVDLHGGEIDVDSEVNKGSCFKIFLPAATINHCTEKLKKPICDYVERIKIEFSDIYST